MNDAQVWTTIGVLATAVYATVTLISTMFVRIMKTEIGSVRTEIGDLKTEVRGLHSRIDDLDRDVSAIYRHMLSMDGR
ncbi:hypothetical protein [Microbacterium sp. K35]|uniref:hypothetical protein n=1 Tax=Microbacterium sp. K35 TaxID=2305440 RepID=UPI00109BDF4B|nr:hypothetical protein [Microbacterium sp. K35]